MPKILQSPVDLKAQTLTVMSKDLMESYGALTNAAGQVTVAATAAMTAMQVAGQIQDPKAGAMFERAMDLLDRAVGALATASRHTLGLQNQIQQGARDMMVKGV